MKNAKVVFQEIVDLITLQEDQDEIHGMVQILLEHSLGISKTDVMAGKVVSVTPEMEHRLQNYVDRINRHEPVQYVVGEAYFYGRKFQVNPSVLIPRPETEELIGMVLFWKYSGKELTIRMNPRILDIGTGCGCVPITLRLEWPGAELFATDISTAALSVGVGNAEMYGVSVNFIEHDILNEKIPLANLDVIVSNPPYIAESERSAMRSNVLDFEPHLALFVPDDDPIVFYREIARKSRPVLNTGGLLAVEINERFGNEVAALLLENGFTDVEVVRDVSGKQRVVKGIALP